MKYNVNIAFTKFGVIFSVCVCLYVCAVCEKYRHVDTFVRVSEPE